MTDDELLKYLYYEKKNYGGTKQLYDKAKLQHPKITIKIVSEWLKNQSSYQLNQEDDKKTTEYLPIYSEIPFNYQIDLTFFPGYADENNGYTVLFTAINVNTRFAFVSYSRDKTGETILNLFKDMHKKVDINAITCDMGSEFISNIFTDYCDKNNITTFFVKNDSHKLGIINRFHRTIKDKLKYYFAADGTLNWVSVIDTIVYNYNHTVNTGIGYEPVKVTDAIENDIINKKKTQTEEMSGVIFPEFKIGDNIRMLRKKTLFQDKMLTKYDDIIYTVVKVLTNSLVVKDVDGNEFKPKKDVCKIISKNTVGREVVKPNDTINDKIIKAGKKTKQKVVLKKDGHLQSDIITEKRVPKQTIFF